MKMKSGKCPEQKVKELNKLSNDYILFFRLFLNLNCSVKSIWGSIIIIIIIPSRHLLPVVVVHLKVLLKVLLRFSRRDGRLLVSKTKLPHDDDYPVHPVGCFSNRVSLAYKLLHSMTKNDILCTKQMINLSYYFRIDFSSELKDLLRSWLVPCLQRTCLVWNKDESRGLMLKHVSWPDVVTEVYLGLFFQSLFETLSWCRVISSFGYCCHW